MSGKLRNTADPVGFVPRGSLPRRAPVLLAAGTLLLAACGNTARPADSAARKKVVSSPTQSQGKLSSSSFKHALQKEMATIKGTLLHPLPVPAKTGAVNSGAGCPAPSGLIVNPNASATTFANLLNLINTQWVAKDPKVVLHYDETLLVTTKAFIDANTYHITRQLAKPMPTSGLAAEPLSADASLARGIQAACGPKVVGTTWRVINCATANAATCDPGLTATTLFLDRNGSWLIWLINSGEI